MKLNYKLSKEIYGVTPWLMDAHSLPLFTAILKDIRNRIPYAEETEIRLNTPEIYIPSNETRIVTTPYGDGWFKGQLENSDDFEGIGVIKLNGPITKSGGASTVGMERLSNLMFKMADDRRIKSFIMPTDSGGGASSAVKLMNDTINEIKKTKPVYGLVEKGGMAASAAFGILSACNKIFAEDPLSIVGSIGTMIQFQGRAANTESKDKIKHIRVYATKSVKKNHAFEEALNNDNYQPLINDLLDPINNEFIEMISKNRPQMVGTNFDDGATHFSKNVIGTFIDGMSSFNEVVQMIENSSSYEHKKKSIKKSTNTNINNKQMKTAEFKAANPEGYNEILAEGRKAEKDRAGAWMTHINTDPEAVKKGIESGEAITQTDREAFFVKQNTKNVAQGMKNESAEDLKVDESITDVDKPKKEAAEKEVKEAFDFKLD